MEIATPAVERTVGNTKSIGETSSENKFPWTILGPNLLLVLIFKYTKQNLQLGFQDDNH